MPSKAGVSKADAAILADALVDADIHGTSTHGMSRLNIYIRRIQKGVIDPKAKMVIERQTRRQRWPWTPATDSARCRRSKRWRKLIPKAKTKWRGGGDHPQLAAFRRAVVLLQLAAEQDMILFAMTGCEPAMSPEGACQAFFGTNPMAASFPTGKGWPVKIDLATSIVARGNIIAAQKRGQPIPPGWALTLDGEPTTDAAAALAGTVLTMAGQRVTRWH